MGESDARTNAVLWQQLDGSGMEYCRVSAHEAGPTIDGVVVVSDAVPWQIDYEVRCDPRWRTRAVTIRAGAGVEDRALALAVDDHGRWTVDRQVRADLQGCFDVDLGFTPSTNTLPIRRLRLRVQQSETIDAAWVEFPSLTVHRVPQRYTRLDERTYRYENVPTGFAADVTVDSDGLVVAYPPGWERINRRSAPTAVFSDSSAPDLGAAGPLYGDLVGRWEVDVVDLEDDGTRRTTQGEWLFGWALEGRAVQDVFIAPKRELRAGGVESGQRNRYGTTIRFYDRGRQAWRIVWINPVSGAVNTLVARKDGDAIVQEGANEDGTLMRWTFVTIERDRFHWVGEESADAGASWRTRAEFFGRRTSFAPLR